MAVRRKSKSGRRELQEPRGQRRYVRRDTSGRFKEVDDTTRSLRKDVKQSAKTITKAGYGDRGDRKRKK